MTTGAGLHPRRWGAGLFPSLHHYRRAWVAGDTVAGLTVWAVLVPEALAYATIAGVSPQVGLYAAPGALLAYAAFASSRHLVVGPMSATAALSAAAVGAVVVGSHASVAELTAALAIVTGVVALLFGVLRLGFVANFISEPVLKGFIIGLALTIMVGQVPKLFGVSKGSGDFFEQLGHLLSHLGQTQGWTLAVGAASLALLVGLRMVWPRVPGELVVVVLSIAVAKGADLGAHGVALVGHVPAGLPHFGVPTASLKDYVSLGGSALGIVLVGFAEGLGAAKVYAARDHYDIDANRELVALGAANVAAGLSAGMVVNGSLSKTAVNGTAGARTQLSGLVVAALTVLTLLFLTGTFADLPEATLAAVVVAALARLIDVGPLVQLFRSITGPQRDVYGPAARADFIASVAALAGVLIFDTLPGLFIGIAISVILIVYRASRPHIVELGADPSAPLRLVDTERNPEAAPVPGVAILRVESGLFFANADTVRDAVRSAAERPGVRGVVLDTESVPSVDITAAAMLFALSDELDDEGIAFVVAREGGRVRDIHSAAEPNRQPLRVHPTVRSALEAIESELAQRESGGGDAPGGH
ncbi:MAG: SulP family inorganic anion transporter [Acidimicrobiales bacterium]